MMHGFALSGVCLGYRLVTSLPSRGSSGVTMIISCDVLSKESMLASAEQSGANSGEKATVYKRYPELQKAADNQETLNQLIKAAKEA